MIFLFALLGVTFFAWWLADIILMMPKLKKMLAEWENKPQNEPPTVTISTPIESKAEVAREWQDSQNEPAKQQSTAERLAEIRQRKAIIEGVADAPVYLDSLDELRQLSEEEARITEEHNIFA
jgi:hypothetical protein